MDNQELHWFDVWLYLRNDFIYGHELYWFDVIIISIWKYGVYNTLVSFMFWCI